MYVYFIIYLWESIDVHTDILIHICKYIYILYTFVTYIKSNKIVCLFGEAGVKINIKINYKKSQFS